MPQSLLDKAQQIQDMGGLATLDRLMNDLPELLTRNREILNEVSVLICSEQDIFSTLLVRCSLVKCVQVKKKCNLSLFFVLKLDIY